ncbi:hypothetical protein M434DRAFT_15469 [Hypoxylon sp. CO27-5]|nr:hypothetical protein M434DRAFT_15469 [Hypoxylon sp. CO27-5]
MDVLRKSEIGPLTFGIEIEIHVPVLKVLEDDPIQTALEFPSDDWYKRNCLFYTLEDGRKIPAMREDVTAIKEARRRVWDALLLQFKETIERPRGTVHPDIKVMIAETEHPMKATTNASSKEVSPPRNTLGNFIDGHYEVYSSWTVCKDESGCWYPKADGELFLPGRVPPIGPERYSWFSIEIKSRVYKDLIAMKEDLQKVCDRIRSRFLVSINCGQGHNRTSTHVHVGRSGSWDPNQEGLPFNLIEMKKLATAMYILELVLMEMHAAWKVDNHRYAAQLHGYTHLGRFCNPNELFEDSNLPIESESSREDVAYIPSDFDLNFRQCSEIKMYLHQSVRDGPYAAGIRMIWGADDLTQLAWLLSGRERTRRGAFAPHGLVPSKENVIKSRHLNTIEFRHMHGSLDAEDIMNWVRIIEKIVSSSTSISDEEYAKLMDDFNADGGGSINEVANDLGLTLAIKPKEQIARETSLPEVPNGKNERDRWSQIGPRIFLSNSRNDVGTLLNGLL